MSNLSNPKPNLPSLTTRNENIHQIIGSQIANSPNKRITFAQFMELALYHSEAGYYATGAVNIGSEGDFFTSPHLCKDFGELLAVQFAQMWDILGNPIPFTLIEMGGGQGLLAADILNYLHQHHPDLFNALEYIIIEKADGLIAQQQKQIQQLKLPQIPIQWCSWDEIAENAIAGCFFSNELVDAFPVHQFIIDGKQLKEIYVTLVESGEDNTLELAEVTDIPSTSRLNDYFDLLGMNLLNGSYPDGYRSEINLAALDWLKTVESKLKQGFVLTIDYGYTAQRYYLPGRNQGTLQCYYRHQHHHNPYLYIGEQDITAHVNFTALERQGELCGLETVGFTQQGLFLMALGLGDRIFALSANSDNRIAKGEDIINIMRRRDVLHQLINPTGLGGFGVLVQSKGLSEIEKRQELKGLTVPPIGKPLPNPPLSKGRE